MHNLNKLILLKNGVEIFFKLYDSLLLPTGIFEKQNILPGVNNANWLYTLCINDNAEINRDTLISDLQLMGVDTRPMFYPMSHMPSFANVIKSGKLDVSINISYRGLSLPSSVTLSDEEVHWICKKILKILKKY